MNLNKGIERIILLLSILVGTTVVVITAQSDPTLNGVFNGGAEVFFGHVFLWTLGFAGVWVAYGAALFVMKGFFKIDRQSVAEIAAMDSTVNYHPLPDKKNKPAPPPPSAPSTLSWREQIDRIRMISSKRRIRLIDINGKKSDISTSAKSHHPMEMIKFRCGFCNQKIAVPKIHAGKRGQCLKCKKILLIPGNRQDLPDRSIEKAKQKAEMRKVAWDAVQKELEMKDKMSKAKSQIKTAIQQESTRVAQPADKKENAQPTIIDKRAKEIVDAIEQAKARAQAGIKAEAKAKTKEVAESLAKFKQDARERLKVEAQAAMIAAEKVRQEAAEQAKARERAIAEARAREKAIAKAKAEKAMAEAKAMAKERTNAPVITKAEPALAGTAVGASSDDTFDIHNIMQAVKNTSLRRI
ncbi:MAG: hypothetical protein JW912_01065 [Sedimentisphaerales bacterium]|nr:hypothetical protein [Sedimentisphaerales bacterium]